MRRTFSLLLTVVLASCDGSAEQPENPLDAAASDSATADDDTGGAVDTGAIADTVVGDGSSSCGCSSFVDPTRAGLVTVNLKETSGLAASRKTPGVLYGHNDSGDTARILAMDSTGVQLGQIDLGGATAVDWEDMAVGPCGGTTCVYVADVGDNGESRNNYALYTIEEPVLDGKAFATKSLAAKKYPFTYPDGKHNCETLLVHPTTGEIYLVTKRSSEDGGVYRFPAKLVAGESARLERVGAAKGTSGSLVTGGDISPCGDRILLRTYGALLSYAIAPGASVADALGLAPTPVPVAKEGQGEAVAFRHDGRGYYTASEGTLVTLWYSACK